MADEPTTEPEEAAPPAPIPEEAAPPAPNPEHDAVLTALADQLGDGAVIDHADVFGQLVVRIAPTSWRRTAEVVKDELGYDYLSFVAGLDWQPAPREGDEAGGDTSAPVQPTERTYGSAGSAGRFQVFAHVQSTTRFVALTLKTDVDEETMSVASWATIYPGADWHERECWEMFGIVFDDHPSLRHLYLPSEFEGHPLRKDFPLLARVVKPWPGLVDVEAMPEQPEAPADASASEAAE